MKKTIRKKDWKTPTRRTVMAHLAAGVSGIAIAAVGTFRVIERRNWILKQDDLNDT